MNKDKKWGRKDGYIVGIAGGLGQGCARQCTVHPRLRRDLSDGYVFGYYTLSTAFWSIYGQGVTEIWGLYGPWLAHVTR
jgi:hypothetical protein